jgi:hypothetical protein
MDATFSPSEEFPALYRSVLEGVGRLEALGQRREAALLRAEATATYATAWDDRARQRLLRILRRIERVASGAAEPRTRPSRRPFLALGFLSGR